MLAIGIAGRQLTIGRLPILGLLLLVHVVASITYYFFAQSNVTDSANYYYDVYHLASQPFSFGSVAIFKSVRFLRVALGASILDTYMIFQSFGFIGMVFLACTFFDIIEKIAAPKSTAYLSLIFLPSVNFWTSAIGKDAPMFFAVSICVWSMIDLRKRFLYFCLGLAVMIFVRAHIALIVVMAVALAAVFDSSMKTGAKIGLLGFSFAGLFAIAGPVESTIGVDVSSVDSVTKFLETHDAVDSAIAGSTSVGDASFPVKLFSLLFRPLFFDADSAFGLVASVENLLALLAFLYLIVHWRDILHLARRVTFVRFSVFFTLILTLSLAIVYYNVGLGLRERVMVYPPLFAILVALWALNRRRHLQGGPRPRPIVTSQPPATMPSR
jgi:hypothetical protein